MLLTRGVPDGPRVRENTLAGTHFQTLVSGLILTTPLLDGPRAPSWETSTSGAAFPGYLYHLCLMSALSSG